MAYLIRANSNGAVAGVLRRTNTIVRPSSESSLQLLNAAKEGDVAAVRSQLERPPEESVDINARGEGQMTPLLLAAEGNHQTVLRLLLLSNSIELNAQDNLGRTVLTIAAQRGLAKVAEIVLKAGVNVLLCAQGGYTALHVAAWYGHTDVVNLLLGISDPQDFSYGDLAIPLETVRKPSKNVSFIPCRIVPSTREKKYKPFRRSGTPENGDLKRPLKEFSNASSEYGGSGDLGSPVESKKFQPPKSDVLKLLEAKTAAELLTPLHLASGNGHPEVVVSLIQAYGQAVGITEVLTSVQEKGGKEALDMIITSITHILNSRGDMYSSDDVMTDVLDKALGRILFQACDLSSLSWSSIDAILSYVNLKDCIGRTPLHHATWEQHTDVVEKLLEVFIVNLNAVDMDGFTPLHLSSWKGSQTMVELLVSHDSNLQKLNPNLCARQNKSTRAKR